METNYAETLEQCINKATQKVRADKPSEICRYLPSQKGGYIHHFTFQKMKNLGSIRTNRVDQQIHT